MEDVGIGNTGRTGRGTCEYHNVPVSEVDILTGNLEYITGSVGGFCCGKKNIIFHQRLNSTGYVYSASLPPLLGAHSQVALDFIDQDPSLLTKLRTNVQLLHNALSSINGISIKSHIHAPLIHVELTQQVDNRFLVERILQTIVDEALDDGVLLTRSKYSNDEQFLPRPSIRLCPSAVNTKDQITKVIDSIRKGTAVALSGINTMTALNDKTNPSITREGSKDGLFKRSISIQQF